MLKHGFSFTEVLIAMAIVGILMTPVIILQNTILTSTGHWSLYIQRIFEAEQLLLHVQSQARITSYQSESPAQEKSIAFPPTTLQYQSKGVSAYETLSRFQDVSLESVTMRWHEQGRNREETLVTFLWKPKPARNDHA